MAFAARSLSLLSIAASCAANSTFLDAASSFLGGGEELIEEAQRELQVMFRALPKNAHGNLDQETSRYALRRHFTQKRGWHFHLLAPKDAGELFGQLSLSEELEEHLPNSMLDHLDAEADGDGLGLPQIAALAATLERLVRDDTEALLKRAFFLEGLEFGAPTGTQEVSRVLETHAILLVLGSEVGNITRVREQMPMIFKRWEDLLAVVKAQQGAIQGGNNVLAADRILEIAQGISHGLAGLQTMHCDRMQNELERHSSPGSGRVPFETFSSMAASAARDTQFFSEDRAMLRSLGALDDSNPQEPQVLMPNYLLAPTNCLGSVGFFQTCCNSRCDAWLAQLEGEVRSPEPSPRVVADAVERLQGVSGDVAEQLMTIAARNAGVVPLHGRDFAQWMHHQFPTICPVPPLSRSQSQLDEEDWGDFIGESVATARYDGDHGDIAEKIDAEATIQDEDTVFVDRVSAHGEVMEEDISEDAFAAGVVEELPKAATTGGQDHLGSRRMGWLPMACMLAAAGTMLVNLGKAVGSMKRGLGEDDTTKGAKETAATSQKVK